MRPDVTLLTVRWDPVTGATGYEIAKDGVVIGKTGSAARTTKVAVDDSTKIEITDLPARSLVQEIDFQQGIPVPVGPLVITTNVSDGQTLTMPFTWTASVSQPASKVDFWADGSLLLSDTVAPYAYTLNWQHGSTHTMNVCAWVDGTRTCLAPGVYATVKVA